MKIQYGESLRVEYEQGRFTRIYVSAISKIVPMCGGLKTKIVLDSGATYNVLTRFRTIAAQIQIMAVRAEIQSLRRSLHSREPNRSSPSFAIPGFCFDYDRQEGAEILTSIERWLSDYAEWKLEHIRPTSIELKTIHLDDMVIEHEIH